MSTRRGPKAPLAWSGREPRFGVRPLDASIRPARLDDEDFLVALSTRVFRAYTRDAAGAMRRMLGCRTSTISVAEHNETRIGFVVVDVQALGRDYGPLKRPKVAHLDAIAVRPNMSSQGVGHKLVAHAEGVARARGAVSMSLLTADTNTGAQRLFLDAGFQVLAPFDDVYADGQRALSMFKAL
ncbi:MAG: GNAT family N-acetyltransferase [Labilithrix sp.]|nr:GNAT family N-acetyltransferase [Labilithrix sp.]MBX3224845.1 GNAT family N-acetyltransferase [Labilithrix sp.]